MGIYAYRTAPSYKATVSVQHDDGVCRVHTVSVYHYAFKLGRSEDNDRWIKRYIDPARRAWARKGGQPHDLGVIEHKGKVEPGDMVFFTNNQISAVEPGDGILKPVGVVKHVFRQPG